jgi:hypothetical protein
MRFRSILLASILAISTSAAFAQAVGGRNVHDSLCSFALTQGKKVQTDCSIHIVSRGEMYCFHGMREMSSFASNFDVNAKKASENFGRM